MSAHLGDITIRLQTAKQEAEHTWSNFTTIMLGMVAEPIKASPPVLAAQDITALLNSSSTDEFPLKVIRSYEKSSDGAAMIMRFELTCTSTESIRLGGVGFAMPESAGDPGKDISSVVWNDPHIGGQHGFVEFVRIANDQATLLVTPADPVTTPLEAWRPMLEDRGHGDAWEWVSVSGAWAAEWAENTQYPFLKISDALANTYPPFAVDPQTPWPACDGKKGMPKMAGAKYPWNPPTFVTLQPKETMSFALRFQLVGGGGPRNRNKALAEMGEPVIHGVPGYVLSTEMQSGALFIQPPKGAQTVSVKAEPVDGGSITVGERSKTPGGFDKFALQAEGRGRARLTVAYSDKTSSTVHYLVVPPFASQVTKLGAHFADVAWLPRDFPDPFGRSASVMPWDRSLCDDGKPCGHVLNDARAYDAGLSDDAGGGNPLGFASKVRAAPTQHEVSRIDDFIQWTLYGIKTDTAKPPYKSLQIREDESSDQVDAIRMTMFYYTPDHDNHTSGHFDYNYTEADKCGKPFGSPVWCMTEKMANATYRGFNFPHQIASYWAMYHVARHYDKLTTRMPWQWYLERAAKTTIKLGSPGVGLMDGTVFREVLWALIAESPGNATFANYSQQVHDNMQRRQQQWEKEAHPYGSEFAFDTTGQEEVVVWNLYFGNETAAKHVVDHILSYMRSAPTWAYNGGTRSWGDAGNNGKYLPTFGTGNSCRGNMHYRSGLNMIPLIEWYRTHPDELFLLEIAMGSLGGQMGNIDEDGATSMMWHAVPYVMDYDPHSGDYGLGFFGNSLENGLYYVVDPNLGTLCYLCDIADSKDNESVSLTPRDSNHINAFFEPVALYMQCEAGMFSNFEVNVKGKQIAVTFSAATEGKEHLFSMIRVKLTKTSNDRPGSNFAVKGAELVRGAYAITPASGGAATTVVVTWT